MNWETNPQFKANATDLIIELEVFGIKDQNSEITNPRIFTSEKDRKFNFYLMYYLRKMIL